MRFRRVMIVIALLAVTVAAAAGAASELRHGDPHAAQWRLLLTRDAARFPGIAPTADRHVAERPLYLQLTFVSGAIGGHRDHRVCPLVQRSPRTFARAARRQIFQGSADYAYVHAQGWTVGSVVTTYRDGVLFGCAH